MDWEARQGFLGASGAAAGRLVGVSPLVVGGLRDVDDTPADSGSADRHTDIRGSGPHVGYPQEGAPD